MEYTLEVNNLCKSYKKSTFKLDDISFVIPKGGVMGFVGKNGAGKSTVIRSILNIINKDSGEIKIFGKEMLDADKKMRNDIGVVFDFPTFYNELTAQQLDKVLADIYDYWNHDKFIELLLKYDLDIHKKINKYSSGMLLKLSLCVAMSHGAKFLILDEATSGLDPVVREEVLDAFLEFVEDENNTILMSSHISSDLEKIADYITFIDEGKIILTENKDTLIYEYGVAKIKQEDFDKLQATEYIASRIRGLHIEVLVMNKYEFSKCHPTLLVDNAMLDDILRLISKEER